MFKKTKLPESTLFESPSNLMRDRALKKYDDPKAWHNQFYELVTSNIDEDVFKPLFKAGNLGRSNASISQLVAIMIMKEGKRRGGHVPDQLPHTQQQDPLSGTCQACHMGMLQMHVDKLHQAGDFPDYNKLKNSFCPFHGSMEALAEPSGSVQRILLTPNSYLLTPNW